LNEEPYISTRFSMSKSYTFSCNEAKELTQREEYDICVLVRATGITTGVC